jgi:hypothetical protein
LTFVHKKKRAKVLESNSSTQTQTYIYTLIRKFIQKFNMCNPILCYHLYSKTKASKSIFSLFRKKFTWVTPQSSKFQIAIHQEEFISLSKSRIGNWMEIRLPRTSKKGCLSLNKCLRSALVVAQNFPLDTFFGDKLFSLSTSFSLARREL